MNTEDNYRIGHRSRLKDRFIKMPSVLPDYEVLEMILFNAIPRKDVKPLAKKIMDYAKNFAKAMNLSEIELSEIDPNIPKSVLVQFALIREATNRILYSNLTEKTILGSSTALNDYLLATMSNKDIENFRILFLNTKNHLIAEEVQEVGTIDQTQVYPREIVKKAIFYGASAIILAHNHPSGVPKPSKADIIMTNKIVEACKTIDVSVHDHVIVGGNDVYSFRTNNLL